MDIRNNCVDPRRPQVQQSQQSLGEEPLFAAMQPRHLFALDLPQHPSTTSPIFCLSNPPVTLAGPPRQQTRSVQTAHLRPFDTHNLFQQPNMHLAFLQRQLYPPPLTQATNQFTFVNSPTQIGSVATSVGLLGDGPIGSAPSEHLPPHFYPTVPPSSANAATAPPSSTLPANPQSNPAFHASLPALSSNISAVPQYVTLPPASIVPTAPSKTVQPKSPAIAKPRAKPRIRKQSAARKPRAKKSTKPMFQNLSAQNHPRNHPQNPPSREEPTNLPPMPTTSTLADLGGSCQKPNTSTTPHPGLQAVQPSTPHGNNCQNYRRRSGTVDPSENPGMLKATVDSPAQPMERNLRDHAQYSRTLEEAMGEYGTTSFPTSTANATASARGLGGDHAASRDGSSMTPISQSPFLLQASAQTAPGGGHSGVSKLSGTGPGPKSRGQPRRQRATGREKSLLTNGRNFAIHDEQRRSAQFDVQMETMPTAAEDSRKATYASRAPTTGYQTATEAVRDGSNLSVEGQEDIGCGLNARTLCRSVNAPRSAAEEVFRLNPILQRYQAMAGGGQDDSSGAVEGRGIAPHGETASKKFCRSTKYPTSRFFTGATQNGGSNLTAPGQTIAERDMEQLMFLAAGEERGDANRTIDSNGVIQRESNAVDASECAGYNSLVQHSSRQRRTGDEVDSGNAAVYPANQEAASPGAQNPAATAVNEEMNYVSGVSQAIMDAARTVVDFLPFGEDEVETRVETRNGAEEDRPGSRQISSLSNDVNLNDMESNRSQQNFENLRHQAGDACKQASQSWQLPNAYQFASSGSIPKPSCSAASASPARRTTPMADAARAKTPSAHITKRTPVDIREARCLTTASPNSVPRNSTTSFLAEDAGLFDQTGPPHPYSLLPPYSLPNRTLPQSRPIVVSVGQGRQPTPVSAQLARHLFHEHAHTHTPTHPSREHHPCTSLPYSMNVPPQAQAPPLSHVVSFPHSHAPLSGIPVHSAAMRSASVTTAGQPHPQTSLNVANGMMHTLSVTPTIKRMTQQRIAPKTTREAQPGPLSVGNGGKIAPRKRPRQPKPVLLAPQPAPSTVNAVPRNIPSTGNACAPSSAAVAARFLPIMATESSKLRLRAPLAAAAAAAHPVHPSSLISPPSLPLQRTKKTPPAVQQQEGKCSADGNPKCQRNAPTGAKPSAAQKAKESRQTRPKAKEGAVGKRKPGKRKPRKPANKKAPSKEITAKAAQTPSMNEKHPSNGVVPPTAQHRQERPLLTLRLPSLPANPPTAEKPDESNEQQSSLRTSCQIQCPASPNRELTAAADAPSSLPLPSETLRQNSDASSPRTESTHQTIPPDTSTGMTSDFNNASESDNTPLAQEQRMRVALRQSKPSNPGLSGSSLQMTPSKAGKQSHRQSTSKEKRLEAAPNGQNGTLDLQSIPRKEPASAMDAVQTTPKKRKLASSRARSDKRQKKNGTSCSESNLSVPKKRKQSGKHSGVLDKQSRKKKDAQQENENLGDTILAQSPKKIALRRKIQSKPAHQSTSPRKRQPAGVKTSQKAPTREKPKGNALSGGEQQDSCGATADVRQEGFSSGSSSALDAVADALRESSKSPCKIKKGKGKGVEAVKGKAAKDETASITPCFASELENLRSFGVVGSDVNVFSPVSSGDLGSDYAEVCKVACVLCQRKAFESEIVKHPCFPVRAFDVCGACANIVSKRVEEHGAQKKKAVFSSPETITRQTTLLVMLIEDLVRYFPPSDRENRDIQKVHDFINNRQWTEMVARAASLSVPFDILAVLRSTLRKIGFTIRAGKLRWPCRDFSLPSFADTHGLVLNSLPARIDDLKKGILPGEAAWDETFGEKDQLCSLSSSCVIYEKLLGLIGMRCTHVTECTASGSSNSKCRVKLDAVSVGVAIYRAAAMLAGTLTQDLLSPCWTTNEAFRFIEETEIALENDSFTGDFRSCCICGMSGNPNNGSCSFRFTNCSECAKSFCSICLLNVLGTPEYARSFREEGYTCMMCRFQKNAERVPSRTSNCGEQHGRPRLRDMKILKKRKEKRMKPMPPFLLLSSSVRADVLQWKASDMSKTIGMAKFCEVANDQNVRAAMDASCPEVRHAVCLSCKLPVGGQQQKCDESGVLSCGHENCFNVMHKDCLPPQRQARRRGSRAKWSCPHHQCSKCEQRDELKLLRCRTCPTAYCKDHMSLPSQIYLFSEKSFACSNCRPFLRVPQVLRLRQGSSKAERKRNQISQALAIDQRSRFAAVDELSKCSVRSEAVVPPLPDC